MCRWLSRSAYRSQRNFNTNCEMMWRPKMFLAESKWFRVSVMSDEPKAKAKAPSLTRYKEESRVRQNRSTPVANRKWFSICVCVFGFFLSLVGFSSPFVHTADLSLDSGPANWRFFFKRIHSFFSLLTHIELWYGVVSVAATNTFSYLLSFCSFQFWPFLCDT